MDNNRRFSFRVNQTLKDAFILAARRLYGGRSKPRALLCGLNAVNAMLQHPEADAFVLANETEKREFECANPIPQLRNGRDSNSILETKIEVSSSAEIRELVETITLNCTRLETASGNQPTEIPESRILRCACRLFTVIAPCLSAEWALVARFVGRSEHAICDASRLGDGIPLRVAPTPKVTSDSDSTPAHNYAARSPEVAQAIEIVAAVLGAGSGSVESPTAFESISPEEHDILQKVSPPYRSLARECEGARPLRLTVAFELNDAELERAAKSLVENRFANPHT